jgi:hypothetical protein
MSKLTKEEAGMDLAHQLAAQWYRQSEDWQDDANHHGQTCDVSIERADLNGDEYFGSDAERTAIADVVTGDKVPS